MPRGEEGVASEDDHVDAQNYVVGVATAAVGESFMQGRSSWMREAASAMRLVQSVQRSKAGVVGGGEVGEI